MACVICDMRKADLSCLQSFVTGAMMGVLESEVSLLEALACGRAWSTDMVTAW